MVTLASHRQVAAVLACGAIAASVESASVAVGAAPRAQEVAASKATLSSVTAVSVAPHSTTAYAFGTLNTRTGTSTYALRRHGARWTRVPVKVPAHGVIHGIAAASPRSAWLVGDGFARGTVRMLVEHSTGGGFKPVKAGLGRGELVAVSASAPTNVWAVGEGLATSTPLIVHSNGKKWKILRDPKQSGFDFNVSTSGPGNVWFLGSEPHGLVAVRWNGHKFRTRRIHVPIGATATNIATSGAHNTWVSGSIEVGPTAEHRRVFTEHWNGHRWRVVKTPAIGYNTSGNSLSAVGSRAYIAGTSSPKSGMTSTAFVMRFSSGKWRISQCAAPGGASLLAGISVSSKGGAAVGSWSLNALSGAEPKPLLENLTGLSWEQAAAPKLRVGATRVMLGPSRPGDR
jgi:hypothetical protein